MGLEEYHGSVSNWREQIQRNKRKTQAVIAFFIAIFLL